MKLLLDTHVLLWCAADPDQLSSEARDVIADGATPAFVSAVTGWELAIKQSLGKLTLARPAESWLPDVLRKTGFEALAVELTDALRVRDLPWHHRDPFDRLLIGQALENGLTIVTRDAMFERYGVAVVRA